MLPGLRLVIGITHYLMQWRQLLQVPFRPWQLKRRQLCQYLFAILMKTQQPTMLLLLRLLLPSRRLTRAALRRHSRIHVIQNSTQQQLLLSSPGTTA